MCFDFCLSLHFLMFQMYIALKKPTALWLRPLLMLISDNYSYNQSGDFCLFFDIEYCYNFFIFLLSCICLPRDKGKKRKIKPKLHNKTRGISFVNCIASKTHISVINQKKQQKIFFQQSMAKKLKNLSSTNNVSHQQY